MSELGWNTIESDAGVFTELIEKLGVKGLEFEELLSIDADTLSSVTPLYGVIFLFKYRRSEFEAMRRKTQAEGGAAKPLDGEYATAAEDVFFAHQVIQNACATQAVLSLLLNLPERTSAHEQVANLLGSTLSEFRDFVAAFDPELKGEAVSNSEQIRAAHNSFSRPPAVLDDDKDHRPDRDEEDDGLYHFIAYTRVHGTLYELDGLHPHPISHGECTDTQFPETLAEVLARRISRAPAGDLRFNLLALTADPRPALRAVSDETGLAREEAKRAAWRRENVLRRANYTGLVTALVRGITAKRIAAGDDWNKTVLEPATKKSRELYNSRKQ
ncbi:uncharacterized protein SAPINGB_P002706 [Magnusiomyces paraingens]|uniref:Ubiquitin carboxyl-terminal hydrolase n=1 Tax=Magnusiomyces paraingens TaxID=2606893 RepID=A0A5E8BFC1_9ASCO|nr:uncharacterized protein SAPINGB_P002706 [Saprochaete ingens]VVT50324.1 unnamed protein product [Saprochaete ingens]